MRKETAIAILLMAGKGERFLSSLPKQFTKMGEQELFLYAAKTLNSSPCISSIVFVVPDGYEKATEDIIKNGGIKKDHSVIIGGNSRQDSVFLALTHLANKRINQHSIVLIHDGDRPNVNERMIEESIAGAIKNGAAVTAVPSSDSIALERNGSIISYLDRRTVYALQTPQTFRFSLLLEAESKAKAEEKFYTDEGSLLLEEKGINPIIVLGEKSNIKITELFDKTIFLAK